MSAHRLEQPRLDFGGDDKIDAGYTGLKSWNPALWPVAADWQALVRQFLRSTEGLQLAQFIVARLADAAVIYPEHPLWALELTPLASVSVLILGQDPYHGPGQAQGLAFSVPAHSKTPPSLRNIFKEIDRDPKISGASSILKAPNSLVMWSTQGVLLLNTVLTVEDGQPASHASKGWECLTDEIVRTVAQKETPVVFMLWGKHAQSKMELIKSVQAERKENSRPHLILTANHPSPLSASRKPDPFLGCAHFSRANDFLIKNKRPEIDWKQGLRK